MLAAASLGVVPACSSGTTPTAPTPAQVLVTPPTAQLDVAGASQQFTAQVLDSDGQTLTGTAVSWSSASTAVATVSSGGLATAVSSGMTTIRATAGSVSGTATLAVTLAPAAIANVRGNNQSAEAGLAVGVAPTVEVQDVGGNGVPDVVVGFDVTAGGGAVSAQSVTTDNDGRASVSWTLGAAGPQRLEASVGDLMLEYSATATVSPPRITTTTLIDGRRTLAYSTGFQATQGSGSGFTWSIVEGNLPSGLSLAADGTVSGSPSSEGASEFIVQVVDGAGTPASRGLSLRVCSAPLGLDRGDFELLDPQGAGECGFFLPAGQDGDYYRIAVVRYASSESPSDEATATLRVTGDGVMATAQGQPLTRRAARPSVQAGLELDRALVLDRRRTEHHARLREMERRVVAELGPRLELLPSRPLASGAARAAPARFVFDTETDSCNEGPKRVGLLVAENQHVAVYQDSIQAATDPVGLANVQQLMAFYGDHGKQIVDQYFGGVSDVNGDGQIVVFITPIVDEGLAAFVLNVDMFASGSCLGSNGMELVYFDVSLIQRLSPGPNQNFQALSTLVHEAKHVSSLYKRTAAGISKGTGSEEFHETWVEEGTAEIASEMASRVAWASAGGPPVGSTVERQDFVQGGFTSDNFGVVLRMARIVTHLSSQPNGLTVDPTTADLTHNFYGPAFTFFRFLGDAYGNASQPFGDGAFFIAQNDSASNPGAAGLATHPQLAGKTFDTLLEEYAAALLVSGTGVPQPARAFTTYDLASATEIFKDPDPVGSYPWPVTITGTSDDNAVEFATFGTATFTGSVGPGGIRVHDLRSNGSGQGAAINVDLVGGQGPAIVIVTRLD